MLTSATRMVRKERYQRDLKGSGDSIYSNDKLTGTAKIEDAKLWWPRGLGDPNLYTFTVDEMDRELIQYDCCRRECTVVEELLLMNSGRRLASVLSHLMRRRSTGMGNHFIVKDLECMRKLM